MPESTLSSPYLKEALTFLSGLVTAFFGLLSKRMLFKKETEDAERKSADETAREHMAAPLEEYKGPIVEEYRRQIADKADLITRLKRELETEHQRRIDHLNNDIDDHANNSQTLSKVAVQIALARGTLETIVENAELSKFDYDQAVKKKDVEKLIGILDSSYRSAHRLKGVIETLEKAQRKYTNLLEDSEAE